jgi:glycosyltransferase involved in cell wall biosynthesis
MLARGLRERGHQVHCLVGKGSWLPDELRRHDFEPYLTANGGSFDVALLRQIVSIIRRHNIELVHAHLFDAAVYAGMAAAMCGVPCVTTLHGQVDITRSGWGQRAKAFLLKRGSSAVVAVSNALRDDLQPSLGVPAHKFRVVYNGVEQPTAQSAAQPPAARASAPNEAFRLIAVGNIRPAKDYPTLLHAVAALQQRGIVVHLDIVGQPDTQGLYESLLVLVEQLALTAQVTFHGFVANPRPLLAQAHVFVLASSREGFSLATIEAMLAGTPVVATRSGGPQEIVRDEVTGLLVPTSNPSALAQALKRLSHDTALATALASAAQSEVRTRFSVAAMLDGYERLYAEVAAR